MLARGSTSYGGIGWGRIRTFWGIIRAKTSRFLIQAQIHGFLRSFTPGKLTDRLSKKRPKSIVSWSKRLWLNGRVLNVWSQEGFSVRLGGRPGIGVRFISLPTRKSYWPSWFVPLAGARPTKKYNKKRRMIDGIWKCGELLSKRG